MPGKRKSNRRLAKRTRRSGPLSGGGITTLSWNVTAQPPPMQTRLTALDNKPYKFVQIVSSGSIVTSNASAQQTAQLTFSFGQLPQTATFAALFDQYRITLLEVWLTPKGVGSGPTYQSAGSRFYSVVDYDDSSALTSSTAAMQYTNCLATNFSTGHYRRFRPHCAMSGYGGSFTQFTNVLSPWIDVASNAMLHYGVKLLVDGGGTTGDLQIDAITRFHIEFRNVF